LFCTNCGKQVPDSSTFCPFCGAAIKAATPPAAPPAGPVGAPAVVPPAPPAVPQTPILLMTSSFAPGYRIEKLLGLVYGITVRSRGLGGNIIAGFRTLGGGEINEYTQMAHQARQQALDRMADLARGMGANAVLSVMFDSTEIGSTMDEIIAFGTAVVISPLESDAKQDYVRLS
jgi:uncharacterized protein YbjQ (UPF0145 family)